MNRDVLMQINSTSTHGCFLWSLKSQTTLWRFILTHFHQFSDPIMNTDGPLPFPPSPPPYKPAVHPHLFLLTSWQPNWKLKSSDDNIAFFFSIVRWIEQCHDIRLIFIIWKMSCLCNGNWFRNNMTCLYDIHNVKAVT